MPTYVYVIVDDDGNLVDKREANRLIKDRELPLTVEGVDYHYSKSGLNYPNNFKLCGPGWNSNSTIKYEDKESYKKRIEEEHKRKIEIEELDNKKNYSNDENYGERIKQGFANLSKGKNSDGSRKDDKENKK